MKIRNRAGYNFSLNFSDFDVIDKINSSGFETTTNFEFLASQISNFLSDLCILGLKLTKKPLLLKNVKMEKFRLMVAPQHSFNGVHVFATTFETLNSASKLLKEQLSLIKNNFTIPELVPEFPEGQLQFSIAQLRKPCVYCLDQKPVWEIKLRY